MQVLHAAIPVDPERYDEALAFFSELGERSRAEEGVIEYRATTDIDDETMVRFLEVYEDEAAVEAHSNTDHFAEFEANLEDFLGGQPEVQLFDVESVDELEL